MMPTLPFWPTRQSGANHAGRGWVTLVGLGLALGLLAGCGAAFSDPEVKDAVERVAGGMEKQARLVQSTHPPGETITAPNGASFTVTSIAGELEGVTASPDEQVIAIDVMVANDTGQALPLQPDQDFYITTETGRAFRSTTTRGFQAGEIAPGETVQGTVAFVIPAGAPQPRFFWSGSPMTAVPLP